MLHDLAHLTADDLDTLLVERPTPLMLSHLATCPACSTMVALDAKVVAALSGLPLLSPRNDLSDRVMASIAIARPPVMVVASHSARSLAARRRAIGGLAIAGGTLVAGFAWAYAHPSDALRWSTPAVEGAGHALWVSMQHVIAGAVDQPWFATLRDTVTTPLRAVLATAVIAGAYALALTGLRGLMTEPATNARW